MNYTLEQYKNAVSNKPLNQITKDELHLRNLISLQVESKTGIEPDGWDNDGTIVDCKDGEYHFNLTKLAAELPIFLETLNN